MDAMAEMSIYEIIPLQPDGLYLKTFVYICTVVVPHFVATNAAASRELREDFLRCAPHAALKGCAVALFHLRRAVRKASARSHLLRSLGVHELARVVILEHEHGVTRFAVRQLPLRC